MGGTRPADSQHTKGITIMSHTSEVLTGDLQQDARTRRLRRLAAMVQAALHSEALTPQTFRLLAALNRDSIELDGIDEIGAERMNELCAAFGLADFQIDAVLRAGAGFIGLFGPFGWADAPPVPVVAISPDGFDRSQVVSVSSRPGHLASSLAFLVEIVHVEGDDGRSTAEDNQPAIHADGVRSDISGEHVQRRAERQRPMAAGVCLITTASIKPSRHRVGTQRGSVMPNRVVPSGPRPFRRCLRTDDRPSTSPRLKALVARIALVSWPASSRGVGRQAGAGG
jgi:hypothetical protein